MLGKILKDSFWFGVVPKLSSIVSILVLPIVTPFLTPEDYGIYGIITAYLSLFTCISTLGLHMHLPNSFFVLKDNYKLLWRRIFGTMLVSCVLLSFVLFIMYLFLLHDIPMFQRIYVSILAVIPLLFSANGLISNNFYVLIRQPKPLVLRNLIGSLVSICVFFVCARIFKLGYLSWLVASALSTVVVFVLFIKPIWFREQIYPQIDKSKRRQKRLFKIALPVIPHSLGHLLLSSADRIIMTLLGISLVDIGLYSNGHQLGDYVGFVIIGIFTAISPVIQKAYRSNDCKSMLYYYYTTQLLSSLIVFFLSIWMREVYQLLIRNEALQQSYLVASVICFSLVMYANYFFMSTSAFIKEKTGYILYLVFVPGLLNIVLGIGLISVYGYLGAAFAMLISNWCTSLIPFFIKYYKNEISYMLGSTTPVLLVLICNLCLLLLSFLCKEMAIESKLLLTLFFLAIGFWLYKSKQSKNGY